MPLETLLIQTGQLEENCFLLWDTERREVIVFDPGDEAERIDSEITRRKLKVVAFLQTHCHVDHIGALTPLKTLYPDAPLYVPIEEKEWLERPTLNLSYFFGQPVTGPKPDHLIQDGDLIKAGGLSFKAIHVPGHSPGGTAFFVEQDGVRHLFGGDILFASGIGRTDLPGGAGEDVLIEGIRSKIFVLPGDTVIHPGHGPETTVGEEKTGNPYCRVRSGM